MKIKFERDSIGQLWHGVGGEEVFSKCPYFNLGFLSVDWYDSARQLIFYFWKWAVIVELEEGKGK